MILSHFISRFMLFSTFKHNIEKCPFTYWLNGRWFLQIVDRDSGNLFPIYPLFPCSDFFILSVGGVSVLVFRKTILSHFMFSSRFMLFPTFLENNFFFGGGWQKNCGVSFWSCWWEISGDRVALFYVWSSFNMNLAWSFDHIWLSEYACSFNWFNNVNLGK